ncbi:MAG: DUF3311 domain-containing protein [Vicinamibacteraceae bacterium]
MTALVLLLFFALHQDLWLWRTSSPLVFGVLPPGLAYHAAYTLAVSLIMAVLVRRAWPSHLEGEESGDGTPGGRA